MKKFIAYFDYLGFRQFIEKNDVLDQEKGMSHIFREIEQAIAKQKTKDAPHGIVADLEKSNINCINFSDTIIFWTEDDGIESLKEILEVSYIFNWRTNGYFFPARGAVVHGELEGVDFSYLNGRGNKYNINSVYGRGLISAYEKAESQNWAGTVIDQSVVDYLTDKGEVPGAFLEPWCIPYFIPYKNGVLEKEEFAFMLVKGGLNEEAFKNRSKGIRDNFESYNKGPLDPGTEGKLKNTIEFLRCFKSSSE
ncbi:hypothetical protein J0A68_19165 [Algoriphagus sp. H41]|uniref:Uncharacterized protein n=1 Tax=Algoriphagus oliviformis TaxID=2811231 RepID=A0ABS3C7J1_9BACT|nr:hypothetical protein [Algoriphagus oliviformis]MBN7813083.1 hypothetical protein [Algoriphagus oliviformis]